MSHLHCVIEALALGGGGGGLEDFGDKGGSQMVDHKKCRVYVNFELPKDSWG